MDALFDVFALVSSLLLELPPPLLLDEPNENMSEILCVFFYGEKAVVFTLLYTFFIGNASHISIYTSYLLNTIFVIM